MENCVSSNLRSPGEAVCNLCGIFYVLEGLSRYTLSMQPILLENAPLIFSSSYVPYPHFLEIEPCNVE